MSELRQVPLQDWLQQYRDSEAARFGNKPNLDSNIFYSSQLMGREVLHKDLKAWALLQDNQQIAWCATCLNSDKTIRFRGIVVDAKWRGQGYGQLLIRKTMAVFSSHFRFILFCSEQSSSYYEKVGFRIVPEFVARPVETVCYETGEYEILCPEKLVLMESYQAKL